MAASVEAAVTSTLHRAKVARDHLSGAVKGEREATIAFMDEALNAHWTWESIGRALGISGTAARRYCSRNRRKVRQPSDG